MTEQRLKNIIESILFVAERPVSIKELANLTGSFIPNVQQTLGVLIAEYKKRGIQIEHKGNYFQMNPRTSNAKYISKYLSTNLGRKLTKEALKTLAIIFYNQPITRQEIEKIRGVDSESVLHNLQIRGLVAQIERKGCKGLPILYGTTMEFIQYFGVRNLQRLLSGGKIKPELKEELSGKLKFELVSSKKKRKKR
jgi:segregation and condensation protein B